MKIKLAITLSILTIVLTGCGSEYSPEEINLSSEGTFVKKGSNSEVSGTFILEEASGKSLTVELDDGIPDGDVEIKDEKGDVILRSTFKGKEKKNLSGLNPGPYNALFSGSFGQGSTNDYLRLFKELAVYDGDYLEVDRNNQKIEGVYDNGDKVDNWKQYCENKQLASDQTFKRFNEDDKSIIKKVGKDLQFTCDGDVVLSAQRDKKGRLQGEYIESYYSSYSYSSRKDDAKTPLKPKYSRQYKDGEFNGLQKEYSRDGIIALESNYTNGVINGVQKKYDRDGNISLENNYKNSVKDGVENVYSASQNYTTKEVTRWLSEIKNYSNGKLNGQYKKLDSKQRDLESGFYKDNQPIGQWVLSNHTKNSKQVVDYDASNFTLEKAKAFKEACFLPSNGFSRVDWSKNRDAAITGCQYYIENGLVDPNKKITVDKYSQATSPATFKRSEQWTYPVITANPKVYSFLKTAGAKTSVTDRIGRTRVHFCLSKFRTQTTRRPHCNIEQLTEYANDVNINSVSTTGTAFHVLALPYQYISKKAFPTLLANEKKIFDILIASGGNINQKNHAEKTPLMTALEGQNYYMAEYLIDAGASVNSSRVNDKSVLGHLFLSNKNKLRKSKLNDNATRVLAKMIALGVDTREPVLGGKTVQTLSEENNKLFHIQALKDATAMSNSFKEELENRPKTDDSQAVSIDKSHQSNSAAITSTTSALVETGNKPNIESISNNVISESTPAVNTTLNNQLNSSTAAQQEQPAASPDASNSVAADLLKEQADFLVIQANEHIANFRLKTPKSNSALGTLEQLKRIDPSNENIQIIQNNIGKKYLSLASGKINNGQKKSAQNNLNSAKEFLTDKSSIAQYQTKIDNITVRSNEPSRTSSSSSQVTDQKPNNTNALICDPVIKLVGIPLIGGQSLTAQQSLPLSVNSALQKAFAAVQKKYLKVKKSGKKITYEQATSTKPIKFTLTVSASGNFSQIKIKAKTPAGIIIKKSGYKQGFCELLADF